VAATATPAAPPACCVVLASPDATPESPGDDRRHDERRHRRQGQAGTDPEQRQERHQPGRVAFLPGSLTEQCEPYGQQRKAGQKHRAGAEAGDQPRGRGQGHRRDRHRDRQERQAGLGRAVAQDAAQVERQDELEAEHAGHHQGLDHVRPGDVAGPEDAQRQQRPRRRGLTPGEAGQQRDRGRGEPERAGAGPAVPGDPGDRADAEHQPGGDQNRAGDVDPGAQADALVRLDHPGGRRDGRGADRDVT
jgi:hypothetical protein